MLTHLIDNFKVDAKSRCGIQATGFPLTCATNTKLLEIIRGILKRYNTKKKPKETTDEKQRMSRVGHLEHLLEQKFYIPVKNV